MNRFLSIIAVVAVMLVAVYSVNLTAQTFSTANSAYPMPVADDQISSFVALSTPTFSVGNVTPVQITGLPAGTKGIYIYPGNGALNYGSSGVTTAATWPTIATSSYVKLAVSQMSTSPGIYMINSSGNTATLTVTIRAYK